MQQIRGDLFEQTCDAIAITTNGFVRSSGSAVMGRGVAAQALKRWPGIDAIVGGMLARVGNHVGIIPVSSYALAGNKKRLAYHLVMFPTKPAQGTCMNDKSNVVSYKQKEYMPGQSVPGFYCRSTLALIEQSAKELCVLADATGWQRIVIPKPGCAAGELEWRDVEPALTRIWNDRFFVISY